MLSSSQIAEWASDTMRSPLEHMRVDLCSLYIAVPKLLLDSAYIGAGFKQMSSKRMTQGVARYVFANAAFFHSAFQEFIDRRLVDVMSA